MTEPPFYNNADMYRAEQKGGLSMKIRPGILLGELVMGTGIALAMIWGFEQVSLVLAGGLCTLLPKLIESEEVTSKQ